MKLTREPVRPLLVADATEEELQKVWRRVERGRALRGRRAQTWSWLRWVSAVSVVVAVVSVGIFGGFWGAGEPLRDNSGRALSALGGAQPKAVTLSDGSSIELSQDSELQVLNNDAQTFSCVLRRGRGTFEVKPGGTRRWRVESGAVYVEVIGTRFTVDRRAVDTRISVSHGTVIVRGGGLPDGVQKLTAGEHLVVPNPGRALESKAAAPPSHDHATPRGDSEPSPDVEKGLSRRASGPSAQAKDAARNSLELADQQRREGDIRGAIQTLSAVVDQPVDAPQRSIAAFTLGKLLLDASGQPAAAAAAFRKCLRLSAPSAVAEDALARLVEAEARARNFKAAREAAREYERRYPSGRRLRDVQRWAGTR